MAQQSAATASAVAATSGGSGLAMSMDRAMDRRPSAEAGGAGMVDRRLSAEASAVGMAGMERRLSVVLAPKTLGHGAAGGGNG